MSELYAELNKSYEFLTYEGGTTNTTKTSIIGNTIYVDAKIDVEKIEKELAEANQKYETMINEVDTLKILTTSLQERVIKNEGRIEEVYTELAKSITEKAAELKADIEVIKNDFITLETKVDTKINEFDIKLTDGLDELRKMISDLDTKIQGQLSSIKEDVSNLAIYAQLIDEKVTIHDEVIKTLSETVKTIYDSLSEVREAVVLLIKDVESLKLTIQGQIDKINEKLNNHEMSILQLNEKIVNVNNELTKKISDTKEEIEAEVDTVYKELSDKIKANEVRDDSQDIDIDLLKQRATNLEGNVAGIKSDIDKKYGELHSKIAEVSGDCQEKINNLDSKLSAKIHEVQVDVENKYNELRTDVDTLSEEMSTYNTEIKGIKTDLTELKIKVDNHYNYFSTKIDELRTTLTAKIDGVETTLTNKITEVDTRLNTKINAVESDLSSKISSGDAALDAKITTFSINFDKRTGKLEDKVKEKADHMYYDEDGEWSTDGEAYWYMMSDDKPDEPLSGPYDFGTGGSGKTIAIFG